MKKILIFTLIAILSCAVFVFAENDDFALALADQLGYSSDNGDEGGRGGPFAISRIWPYDETKTIVVLAYPSAKQEDENSTLYDLDIILADSKTSSVVARYTNEGELTSDAIYITGIEIDTGLYNLKKGLRAFGVRVAYRGSSSVDQYENKVLSLYIQKGKEIQCVLDSMIVVLNGGEWDQQCEGHFRYVERGITMSKKTTKGYRDIIVDGTVKVQVNEKDKKGDCNEREYNEKPEKFTVKYDGSTYIVPEGLRY